MNDEYLQSDPNREAATFLMLRGFRKEFSNRKWGKLAVLRKFGDGKLYFPQDYSPHFAYLARSTFYGNIMFVA